MTDKLPERLLLGRLTTPIGEALIVTDERGQLRALDWADYEVRMAQLLRLHYGSLAIEHGVVPRQLGQTLRGYFEGEHLCLGSIKWRTAGTPVQRAVWTTLTTI